MICSCPKCHANIEVDLSSTPENGTMTTCPECKGRFWANKESYARAALKKEGITYCDKCGQELDHAIVCKACGIMYPDYYLVQASKPLLRQVEKQNIFSIGFNIRPARPTYSYAYTSYTPARKTQKPQRPSVKSPGKGMPFKRAAMFLVVALLAVGAAYFYHVRKVEQEYANNFMRALFTIKSGADLSLGTCAKISSDWKAQQDAGQVYTPRISVETEAKLNKVKNTTENYLKKLNKPPSKFADAQAKLNALYEAFARIQALAISPSGSYFSFTKLTSKSENDFKSAVNNLKTGLPPKLSEELVVASSKYKKLKNL